MPLSLCILFLGWISGGRGIIIVKTWYEFSYYAAITLSNCASLAGIPSRTDRYSMGLTLFILWNHHHHNLLTSASTEFADVRAFCQRAAGTLDSYQPPVDVHAFRRPVARDAGTA